MQECLIQKPWKIIRTKASKTQPLKYELFNIEKDPNEKDDVILQNETIAGQMKTALENQYKKDAEKVNK